jgi:glycosyltransferase involved in cell wall biosynthesis
VPLHDEAENVDDVHAEITAALSETDLDYEVVYVDDGSRDRTVERLRAATGGDRRVTIVELARRFGQTVALAAGFRYARGKVIVPMDGDLQNDPRDIPRLVARLDEPPGWDVVSGWRRERREPFFSRRLPSLVANRLIARLTHMPEVHDFGCTLKAYRREALDKISLYGDLHRFLPAICKWQGARVTEAVVRHRPRLRGTSKYGLRRTFKVLLDLVAVKFLGDYLTKPLYFFGKAALASLGVSCLSLAVALAQKLGYLTASGPVHLNRNVLVLFSMMLFLMAILFVMMGVLSELLVRIYHETRGHPLYKVRRVTGRGGVEAAGDEGAQG